MKRALIAFVVCGFVVAAIGIARENTGADVPPEMQSSASDTPPDDADQLDPPDIETPVADATEGSHVLLVTIREERPGDVWVRGRVAGKPACVTPARGVLTWVNVTAGFDASYVVARVVPAEARLMPNGACQATLKLLVHPMAGYEIAVAGPGHRTFDLVKVAHGGEPQKVTLVG